MASKPPNLMIEITGSENWCLMTQGWIIWPRSQWSWRGTSGKHWRSRPTPKGEPTQLQQQAWAATSPGGPCQPSEHRNNLSPASLLPSKLHTKCLWLIQSFEEKRILGNVVPAQLSGHSTDPPHLGYGNKFSLANTYCGGTLICTSRDLYD